MTFENQPERADDSSVPDSHRPFLWLASKVIPVLSEAANAGKRLDVQGDREQLALDVVAAVLRELYVQGNVVHVLQPPAEESEASDFSLTQLVTDLLTNPNDAFGGDWEAQLHPWYGFLRTHAADMSDEEKIRLGIAYATATTAAEHGDGAPARFHLPWMIELAQRWRTDPAWPGGISDT